MLFHFKSHTSLLTFAVFILALICMVTPLYAEEAAAKSSEEPVGVANAQATSPAQNNSTAGSNSGNGFSAGGSQFTGSATASIPIIAPPGRSEATTPQIALTYSSSQGNGFAGMGWDLNLGYINRNYATNILDYLKPGRDPIHLVTGGGPQELVLNKENVNDHEDTFRLQVREGIAPKIRSFRGIIHGANPQALHWTVSNPDGTKYDYGSKEASRLVVYTNIIREAVSRYYLDCVEDPEGHRKTQTKDPLGRLVRVEEDSDGRVLALSYAYNAAGDLTGMTDARGDVTAMTYDGLGRKKTLTDPHTGSWSYGYDPDGRLISQRDPTGQLIRYRYDALGRIIRKSTDTETLAAYRYDTASNGKGRLGEASRGQVTDRIEGYDPMGRPTGSTRTFTNLGKSYTTRTSYDIAGRVAEMTYPDNTKSIMTTIRAHLC